MTLTRNDPEDVKASAHLQNEKKMLVETKRVNIVNSYIFVYQPLTPFLPSYSDKNLLSPLKFCIFAPAIEGTAYCAENRSSIKTGAGLK